MDVNKLQEVHDRLVASRPDGAECPTDCPFCSGEFASSLQEDTTVSDKTFTEDELAAAVAKATADIRAELDAFKTSAETAEVDARIEAAKAEAAEKVAELETRIDTLTVEAEAAKTERDAITTWLEAEAAKVVEEAEAAARLESRTAAVAAVITFPAERIAERAPQWAALDDTQFEALLADYQAMATEASAAGTAPIPAATAMHATRDAAGGAAATSPLIELIRGRSFGIDPRDHR